MIKLKNLAISLIISLSVGAVSGILTRENTRVLFDSINKSSLTPPAWVFPVVWTILFALMGVSSYFVYESKCKNKTPSLIIYSLQLLFNFAWSIIFFNFAQFETAFIWLVLLWLMVFAMIILFFTCNKKAAYLQIPYILWLSFAGYLSFYISVFN